MNKSVRPYDVLGEAAIRKVVAGFYHCMASDPAFAPLRKMHAQDLTPMVQKLGDFLVDWLGGPAIYREHYGSLCMTKPHKPYHIGNVERDMWLACFEQAVDNAGLAGEEKTLLMKHVTKAANAVRNSPQV